MASCELQFGFAPSQACKFDNLFLSFFFFFCLCVCIGMGGFEQLKTIILKSSSCPLMDFIGF